MRLSFAAPWWLLALPLAVGALAIRRLRQAGGGNRGTKNVVIRQGHGGVSDFFVQDAQVRQSGKPTTTRRPWQAGTRREWTGLILRGAVLALLVLALADPRVGLRADDVDVAFLVDASDSVGAGGREAALEWVREAAAARGPGDRVALALFGRDARVEGALSHSPDLGRPAVVVDRSGTDLAGALRLAEGVLGSDARRRVVLLTDGRQTQGDVVEAAAGLAAAGIGLDVVRLDGTGTADALVTAVAAPSRVREGEAYEVAATVRNTGAAAAEAVVVVSADGQEVERLTLTLAPGDTEVAVDAVAEASGTVAWEARLETSASTQPANDVGRAAVAVSGPPRVLVHQRVEGLADELARALEAGGVPVDVTTAEAVPLPGLARLLDYTAVVLVDVPAASLGEDGMQALDAYVRDAGRGLVAVGGEASFGLGDYDRTPLEDLLPVFARVTDPRRRPSVAEALVVDTSGSMAACHCADQGAFGAPPLDPGINKTDIARAAIGQAVQQLEATDILGVLAFNTTSEWVIPLQQLPEEAVVEEGLARLHPDGNTDIVQAVRQAIEGLRDADARLRHIVLFSDGFTTAEGGLIEVAQEAAEAGMTLSVVGTGEGSFDILREMAEAGGGRYYPGRDLRAIPDIIALELLLAARPIVTEGAFVPTVTGLADATEDLDAAPVLTGYLATTAKPTARTLLSVGDERDPLLATWQVGLGQAVAWTSDVTSRWSAAWVGWERYPEFWADVVKDTFPAEDEGEGIAVDAVAEDDAVAIAVTALEDLPPGVEALATVSGPGGQRFELPLERTGLRTFEARADAAVEGTYAISLAVRDGGEVLARDVVTATRVYPAEYAAGDPADATAIERAVVAAGGRIAPSPADVFAPAGLAPGSASLPVWPLLAALALVAAVAEVAVRRLRLERADWARARAAITRSRLRRRTPVARDDATEALFAARDRGRGRR